jgi:3-phosphoshikimate 1-carboxyvinyltransferase
MKILGLLRFYPSFWSSKVNNKPNVLVVGLGLIGGSFAKAMKVSESANVYGYDCVEGVAEHAKELGVIDVPLSTLEALEDIQVVILAVPVMAITQVVSQLKPIIPTLKVLSDVGSVKGAVVDAVKSALGTLPACFVPGHPIAGAEKSGVAASDHELFKNHMHILTPLEQSDPDAVSLLTSLWQECGAEVVTMSVQRHDEVLAATSHLPHLLAFSLVDTLARESENREIFKYAAGGFRDFSRIAASDPTMWHDIFLSNGDATLKVLRRFQSDLSLLERAIENSDGDLLQTVFSRSKSARDYFSEILESRNK